MLHAEMQLVTFWGGGGKEKSKENAKMYFKTFYAIAFYVAPIPLSPFEHKPVDVAINLILKVWLFSCMQFELKVPEGKCSNEKSNTIGKMKHFHDFLIN